jgi:hypothetical protein
MKTIRNLALAALVLLGCAEAAAAQITQTERERLVAHLEMTSAWFLDEVSSLSQAQLDFKPSPRSWSIRQVIDHLVVVGQIYWDDLQKALKTPMRDRAPASGDAEILWYGIDRSYRETALAPENPRGQLPDLQSAFAAYRKHHARLHEYAKTTNDDLRKLYVERQRSDAYQWALLISTHEQRHILQIREIKADQKYPKK